MKKLTTLFIALSMLSCNDGDFDVPAFEFTDTVKSCGSYILYKTNTDETEVIALSLSENDLGSKVGEKSIEITTTKSVTYRIFDEGIGENYFCQSIPPVVPKVLKELNAVSGSIHITTSAIESNGTITGYTYVIRLVDLLFMDDNERILFENFDFGTITVNL